MKTRQFKRLGGLSKSRRTQLVLDGLRAVGANVVALSRELEKCNDGKAFGSARLVNNAGREEAGKFLVLIDAYRAPGADEELLSRQFERAGNHLAKLIYARMADYSIASQAELVRAIDGHRRSLYLDGPNDHDWIFRNDLLSERENALYVDLVDAEGSLEWWTPHGHEREIPLPFSMRLVDELLVTDLVTEEGLSALQEAWQGFDAHADTHCREWSERTAGALASFPNKNMDGSRMNDGASFIARQWPMPLVELDLRMITVGVDEMVAEREAAYQAWMRSEFGEPW